VWSAPFAETQYNIAGQTILSAIGAVQGTSGGSVLDETSILVFGDHGMVKSGCKHYRL